MFAVRQSDLERVEGHCHERVVSEDPDELDHASFAERGQGRVVHGIGDTVSRVQLDRVVEHGSCMRVGQIGPFPVRYCLKRFWRNACSQRLALVGEPLVVRSPELGGHQDRKFRQSWIESGVVTQELAEALCPVAVLRRVWARHFERAAAGSGEDATGGEQAGRSVRMRSVQGRGPGDRVESPYDSDARFRSKRDTRWTGYMVHLTETCDEDTPRLVVNTDTTPANVHEAPRTGPIHDALAAKGLVPSEHLVDSAYVSADHLVAARTKYDIDLVGPGRRNLSWQSRSGGEAFTLADFKVDWDRRVARCPEGKESTSWTDSAKHRGSGSMIHVQFRASDCRACASRARCTRARSKYQGRVLALLPRPEHDALAAARARAGTADGKRLYAQRNGIEGTLSQAVRGFGLRKARYRGLPKTGLQHVATAAALNLDRIAAWLAGRPLAPTRTSRFAALAA